MSEWLVCISRDSRDQKNRTNVTKRRRCASGTLRTSFSAQRFDAGCLGRERRSPRARGDGRLDLCTLITQREQVCSLTQSPISPGQVRLIKPTILHTHTPTTTNGKTAAQKPSATHCLRRTQPMAEITVYATPIISEKRELI